MRVPENRYFNKDFVDIFQQLIAKESKDIFQKINFFYLFNHPWIQEKKNGKDIDITAIRINEDLKIYNWDKNFIKEIDNRRKKLISELEKSGYSLSNQKGITLNLSWRMVIGLGATHPQETSMTLHHIYGIPYVPGSAIKGVTRHYCVQVFAEEYARINSPNISIEKAIKIIADDLEKGEKGKNKNLEVPIKDEKIKFCDLIEIFGTQQKAGQVIFFDAYPINDIGLNIDIMNPHYPDYYSGKQPPTDWQNPVPIKFLTVEKTKFQFFVAGRNEDLCNKAMVLLKEALTDFGIGAKTALGYGIFENREIQ